MSEQEQLIQNIIDAPDDDAPRLAYAAWLDRQGPSAHAELIRVQCELARTDDGRPSKKQTQLQKREKELLDSPELEPMDWARGMGLHFVRGFIPQVDDGSEGYDSYVDSGEPEPPHDWRLYRDKVLTVHYFFGQDSWPGPRYMEMVAPQDWWRRVTCLRFDQTQPSQAAIEALAESPHLLNLRELVMEQCAVPIDSMHSLVLAPSIRGLTRLTLADTIAPVSEGKPATLADDPRPNEFLVRVASSPKMARLETLGLHFWKGDVGRHGALALLQSPYLTALNWLYLRRAHAVPPDVRAQLRARFSRVELFGPDGYINN